MKTTQRIESVILRGVRRGQASGNRIPAASFEAYLRNETEAAVGDLALFFDVVVDSMLDRGILASTVEAFEDPRTGRQRFAPALRLAMADFSDACKAIGQVSL